MCPLRLPFLAVAAQTSLSNWEAPQLTPRQIVYAALDVFVAHQVHARLEALQPQLPLPQQAAGWELADAATEAAAAGGNRGEKRRRRG
jgi:ribonuclease D